MGKTKSIEFQFFQIILQKEFIENNQSVWKAQRVFDFKDWLQIQHQEGNVKKNINVNNDFLGNLDTVALSKTNRNICFARFYKLRDIVPAKVKDGIGAESIELDEDEYIGEDVSILYDDSNGVCILQRNRFSLSYLKIADWLSMSCEEGYRVRLKPINDSNMFGKLSDKNVRSFELSFANLGSELEEAQNGTLKQMMRSVQYYDGVTASVKIGVGRKKHGRLNQRAMDLLLEIMNRDRKNFTKAKVTISDENDANIEVLDLLDAIMSSTINVTIKEKEILDFDSMAQKMENVYNNKKEELSKINIFPR